MQLKKRNSDLENDGKLPSASITLILNARFPIVAPQIVWSVVKYTAQTASFSSSATQITSSFAVLGFADLMRDSQATTGIAKTTMSMTSANARNQNPAY